MARTPPPKDIDELTELDAHMAWRRIVTVMRRRGIRPRELEESWAGRWLAAAELIEWLDRKTPETEGAPPVRRSTRFRTRGPTLALRR